MTTFDNLSAEKLKEISSKGGSQKTEATKKRGFASMTPERRRELAVLGGKKSKRPKNV